MNHQISQQDWVSQKKQITLSNNLNVKYIEMGDTAADPAILIHGYSDTSRSWSEVANLLAKDFHLYIPDLRGHGDTGRTAQHIFTVSMLVDDLVNFMDALSINKASVIGHSLGTLIGQSIAAFYPERIDKLVLAAAAATCIGNPAISWLQEEVDKFEGEYPEPAFVEDWVSTVRTGNESLLSNIKIETAKTPVSTWKAALAGLAAEDISAFLSGIAAPTLVIWGTSDELFSAEHQDELIKLIPNAKLIKLEGAGHNIPWEAPEEVTELIKNHLK